MYYIVAELFIFGYQIFGSDVLDLAYALELHSRNMRSCQVPSQVWDWGMTVVLSEHKFKILKDRLLDECE